MLSTVSTFTLPLFLHHTDEDDDMSGQDIKGQYSGYYYYDLNIYANYSNKLSRRYKNYDYTKFPHHYNVFNNILTQLKLYENNNNGFKTIIHGDPVFTNILIDNNNTIKFISYFLYFLSFL